VKNTIANYSQKVIRTGIGLVCIGIIARYLDPNGFGQYTYIVALMTLSEITAGMGISMILCREINRKKAEASSLLGASLVLELVLSVTTIGFLGLVVWFIVPTINVFYAAILCGMAEILKLLGRLFWSVYQAYERMVFGTIQAFVSQGLYLTLLMIVVNFDLKLHGIFGALLVAHLGGCIFGYVVVRQIFIKPKFTNMRKRCLFFLREVLPLAIRGVFSKLNYRAGTLLLAAMKTNVAVAMFSGPYRIILHAMFIGEGSSQAVFPIFSRLKASSDITFNHAYEKSGKFALVICLPIAILMSCFSETIVVLVLGSQYLASAPVLQVLGWALVPVSLFNFAEKALVADNKQYLTVVATSAALLTNVMLNLILIPGFSYIGAGVACLASDVVAACLGSYFVLKKLGVRMPLVDIIKPLAAGLVTYVVLSLLGDISLILGGIIGLGLYIVLLLAIRTFTSEEVVFLQQLLKKVA